MGKWICLMQMPSGSLWVVSPKDDGLALFPVERCKEIALKGIMAFNTKSECQFWIDETSKLSADGKRLMERTKPFLATEIQ